MHIGLDLKQSRERVAWEAMIFDRMNKRDATSIASSM
jgi:hypothetical protein